MDINQFTKKFKKKLKSYKKKWGSNQRFFHLIEETGEFAEIILQFNGYKRPRKNIKDIRIALADILEDVLALSIFYKIDIEDLFTEIINEKNK